MHNALAQVMYPSPPWRLWGSAFVASFAVRTRDVVPLVPEPFTVRRVPGGLAMGYLAVWQYEPGSTVCCSELVAGVLVHYQSRTGMYVTHMGVDSTTSQRAGRDLWYLPKQHWQFEWNLEPPETSVRVWDGVRLVCIIRGAPPKALLWPLHTPLTFFTLCGTEVGVVTGDFDVRVARVPWKLQLGPSSPLMPLKPVGPVFTFALKGRAEIPALEMLPAE